MPDNTAAPRKSIHLFDLDDTLIQTSARVLVRDAEGSLLRALSPAEFTGYRPGPGEAFDFREFSDLGILSRGIVVKYTRSIIDSILRAGTRSHFGILTARADKSLHAPFLIRLFRSLFGIRLAKEHIFAISDERFARHKDRRFPGGSGEPGGEAGREEERRFLALSVAQRKALVIAEDLIGRGFNDISFYDDSRENLDSFKVMLTAFPHVKYKPHFIDPTWKARIKEFVESGKERKCLIKGLGSVRIILEHHSARAKDHEDAVQELLDGYSVPLDTHPLWIVHRDGRYWLVRKDPAGSEPAEDALGQSLGEKSQGP